MTASAPSTIVINMGKAMRGDDGFGPAVIAAPRRRPRPGEAVPADCDGEPTRLVDLWDGYDFAVGPKSRDRRTTGPGKPPAPGSP